MECRTTVKKAHVHWHTGVSPKRDGVEAQALGQGALTQQVLGECVRNMGSAGRKSGVRPVITSYSLCGRVI